VRFAGLAPFDGQRNLECGAAGAACLKLTAGRRGRLRLRGAGKDRTLKKLSPSHE
jgi:hypothetical protein